MIKNAYRELLREHEWLPVALLLCLGFVLRLAYIGALPFGLNQDEASAGYEAFALLTAGMDRCGDSWPVLFTSWGSGQNVLMSYLAIPFVALLGLTELSVRLPNAIAGCLTLVVFWRLARRARGRSFGVCALFLLAVNPWHIMMSRWALESNLFPFFLLTGIWLTAAAKERPWLLLGAAGAFGLSLYAYGTAFFFLPLYLIAAVVWLRRDLRALPFLVSLLLFLILALPIAVCQTINMLDLEEINILGVTLPKLTENRQTATSVFGGGGFAAAEDNFRGFLRILWAGNDGLPYNALPIRKGGIFYFFGLPTAALGFLASFLKRKDRTAEAPLRIALVCSFICAFLIRCNINRINMVWLPLVYFSVVGCWLILSKLESWAALPVVGIMACFLVFLSSYCRSFGYNGYSGYYPGLGAAIEYAETVDAETVYITNYVNQPYSFALFYTQTPPELFVSTVEYRNENAAFRQVKRFAGYEFERPEDADVLILHRGEEGERTILACSGEYLICAPEEK